MDFTIRKWDKSCEVGTLYDFIQGQRQEAGYFHAISNYDLESVLLNGITYLALNQEKIVGVIQFEVLFDGNERFCMHNLALAALEKGHDEVMDALFEAERNFLKSVPDVHYIKTFLFKQHRTLRREMEQRGFVKVQVWQRNYKAINYIGVEYRKSLTDAVIVTNRLRYLKSFVMMHVLYGGHGGNSAFHRLYYRLRFFMPIHKAQRAHRQLLAKTHAQQKAKVLFIASSVAMWKYQYLYDLLVKDARFEVYVMLSPFLSYEDEQKEVEMQKLRSYFDARGMKYFDFKVGGPVFDVKREVDPDVLFYTQMGDRCLHPLHAYEHFTDRMLTYYPYGFYVETAEIYYNSIFQNIAWKLFYSNELQVEHARDFAVNQGKNVVITGYPTADDFVLRQPENPWKPCGQKKRIIWAPHFSINANTSYTNHSNFLWMADFMLELAKRYSDRIQIAFKPHPRLCTELYNNILWGKERTDAYYAAWDNLENGQVETGDFIDLFLTSDAMVHDSASFCVDYLYTGKPVMYVSHDLEAYKEGLDPLGKEVMDMHYLGQCLDDVQHFVDDIVLGGQDHRLQERQRFVEEHLLPPHGKTTAQNTMDEMVRALFL